jgi:transcriptional regulator with XRE-family HTH domain
VGETPVQSQRTVAYDALLTMLREGRELRGISQRELSKRLGQQFTYVAKIELGTRRVDVVELVAICSEIGVDPTEIVGKLRSMMVADRQQS